MSRRDFGAIGFTVWTEPLGKHTVAILSSVSAPDPVRNSSLQIGYLNNQYRPQIEVLIQRFPDVARPYGNGLLRERTVKLNLTSRWPLQLTSAPFVRSSIALRARYVDVDPLNTDTFDDELVPLPESGHQADLRLSLTIKRQEPYRHNVVHPLDGVGVRFRAMGALRSISQRTGFVRLGVSAYGIVPGFGRDRFFGYARIQYQRGETLAQNFIGLSRYDELQPTAPGLPELWSSDVERVRGYRQFAVGKSVWYGTVEYRVPILGSLETRILGLVSLGATSVSAFADGALVYPDYTLHNGDRRLGVGVEVKNAVTLYGLVTIMHALGVAQRSEWVGSTEHELYYRIRAAVPF